MRVKKSYGAFYWKSCMLFVVFMLSLGAVMAQDPDHYIEIAKAFGNNNNSDSAAFYCLKAAEILEERKDWERATKYYNRASWYFYNSGKMQPSMEASHKASEILSLHFEDDHPYHGTAYLQQGRVQMMLGKLDAAEKLILRALELVTRNYGFSDSEVARVYFQLGMVAMRRIDYVKALDFFETALTIYQKTTKRAVDLADCYNSIAVMHYYRGDYENAEINYKKGLDILATQEMKGSSIRRILNNLGAIAYQRKNYTQASEYYTKVYEWEAAHLSKTHPYLGDNFFNLGEVFFARGQYPEAIDFFEKSIENYQLNYGLIHVETAEVFEKLGSVYQEQGNRELALKNYRKALGIYDQMEGSAQYRASAHLNLGEAFLREKQFDSARLYLDHSRQLATKVFGAYNPTVASSLITLSKLQKEIGDWNGAIDYSEMAFRSICEPNMSQENYDKEQIIYTTPAIDILAYQSILLQEAFKEEKVGVEDLQLALERADWAIELISKKRRNTIDQGAQYEFSDNYAEVFQAAAHIAFQLYELTSDTSYLEQSFQIVESNKALTLNRSLQAQQNAHLLPDSILRKERKLKVDIAYYKEEILQRKADPSGYDTTQLGDFEERLFHLNRDFETFKELLESDFPNYYQLRYSVNPISIGAIQNQLGESEQLVEYFWGDSTLLIYAISASDFLAKKISFTSELKENIENYKGLFVDRDPTIEPHAFASLSNEVYRAILQPTEQLLTGGGINRLVVIPDGPLGQLNFDLLVTQLDSSTDSWKALSYLIKSYALSSAFSATTLFSYSDTGEDKAATKDLLAFSFGDEATTGDHLDMERVRSVELVDLPGTIKEIKSISERVEGDYYYGSFASEKTFKEVSGDYQILHLAVHGSVNEDNPDYSKLYFQAEDTVEDGKLHVFELYNMELNADLAVLSACNTGSGKYQTGEGIMSLGHAFSYAGVNSLLLTRWELSDDAAPEIMNIFYRELKKGNSKSESLRTAKLEYLEQASLFRANPFYWGSFFVLGDDSPVTFANANRTLYYALIGGFLILLLGFLNRKRFS